MNLRTAIASLLLTACSSGVDDACVENHTPVDQQQATVLGFSPADVLRIAEGHHDTRLASQHNDTTALSITVDASGDDANWVSRQPNQAEHAPLADASSVLVCPDALRLPAQVAFRSADGSFDETWSVELESADGQVVTFDHRVALYDLTGTFGIDELDAYQSVTVHIRGQFTADGTIGTIDVVGSSTGSGDEIRHIAVWPGE